MPRPKKIVKRSNRIVARVSPLEKKVVQLSAEKCGLTESDYLRKSALHQKIKLRLSEEELEVLKTLTDYRSNFQRLANLINKRSDMQEVRQELNQTIKSIDEQLKKLQ